MSLDIYLETIIDVGGPEPETIQLYTANITHNLNRMAREAGIYEHIWRPEELGIEKAGDLIQPLTAGMELLKAEPERFYPFNPANGWGSYNGLVEFVDNYLEACRRYPNATIKAWR